ncbi:protease II [Kineosphaera limosa NBRC 100340]|uniref:Protease II n=1 Tax=Kineosphaera limosa NBRC 100340 TaxID=1184609 RepID=K6WW39_9MICO|nr:protease II [Kineosphaera limosa NBRC 100340]
MPHPDPPVTQRREHTRRHHGRQVQDPYAWLGDPHDEAVLDHLRAENSYARAVTAHTQALSETLVREIRARTQESDLSVPVGHRGWWYYRRTVEGLQYGIEARVPMSADGSRPQLVPGQIPAGEQLLLDGNAEAGTSDFFAYGAFEVSPDSRLLAYAVDLRGDERFTLRVRDIDSGQVVEEVTQIGYGVVWSLDGRHLFYTRLDDAWRPHEVWRHELGTPAEADVRVFAEPDERFWLGIGVSRDDRWLVVQAGSRTTTQARLLDLAEPTGPLRVVAPRVPGLEYEVEPAANALLVVHNAQRPDFELAWMPWPPPEGESRTESASEYAEAASEHAEAASESAVESSLPWRPWLAVGADERVVGVEAFAGQVVVSLRSAGLPSLRIVPWDPAAPHSPGEPFDLPVEQALASVSLSDNPEWATRALRYRLESFVTPVTVAEFDVTTRTTEVLKRAPVLGGYDPGDYREERLWASAADGTRVPVSVVSRAQIPRDGSAPGLLYVYGAYETCLDPWFSIPRLSLLDRGLVFAVAHVRGGGELGRSWYEDGKLAAKTNTFTDTVAAAHLLLDEQVVDRRRLGIEGGSAGGLTVGAALNLEPGLFRVALAQVPFVDALTTILDPELPLTVIEWDEWGDPLHDVAAYDRMAGYSPYETIVAGAQYPAILATTSLHDTRVAYTEPAKWVARLRELTPADPARPILLRTEMTAGHGGRSGRYDAWEQYAWENAFLLDQLDATHLVPGARDPLAGARETGPGAD